MDQASIALCFPTGSALQRPPARPRASVRGQGQRPAPHGHQRQGRPLPRPPAGTQASLGQGELRLQAAQPRLWQVLRVRGDLPAGMF